jgi:hypothetical protein
VSKKSNIIDIKDVPQKDIPKRRVRMLMVSPQDFLRLFTKGFKIAENTTILKGVPEDAKVVSMTIDHVRDSVIFVVESTEYDEIPMNEMPPFEYVEIKLGK